jgi:hypothetical protein
MHELLDLGSAKREPLDAAPQRLSLSICAMTRGGSGRLAAVLELLRPLALQVVVALDDRAEGDAPGLATVADELFLFPHREPGDSLQPWLHAQCGGSWILNLDDDEVPSTGLLARLPELLAADVTQWWLPRRWLFGDAETFLDQAPWIPDYQLRLYRNDPATLRFSDEFHRPLVVSGAAGFAREPLWHLDCLLTSVEHRRNKAAHYERERRGMRVAGLAHNSAFYLPELLPGARTGAVPESDVRLIRSVIDSPAPLPREPGRPARRVSGHEIEALWPGEPFDPTMWSGELTRLETLDRLPAGARHTITVAVANHGRVGWQRGPEASPLVQVATRWLSEDGSGVEEGLHTSLPADLPPGGSLNVPVHVLAPSKPGGYQLYLDLVHEHVRWFDCALTWSVDVSPAHRVAVVGRGEQLEQALDRIQLEPEIEPLIVGRDGSLTPERFGHPRIPGLVGYLLAGIEGRIGPIELARLCARSAKLLHRAHRLRAQRPSAPLPNGAEECLVALAGCERLLITGADWPRDAAPTRQLWCLAVTAAVARRLGLSVEIETELIHTPDALDRLLARLVRGRWMVSACSCRTP